jgi:hypothetical protein
MSYLFRIINYQEQSAFGMNKGGNKQKRVGG